MSRNQKTMQFDDFKFGLTPWIPYTDREACRKARNIKRADICNHPNPDLKIQVIPDAEFNSSRLLSLIGRIKHASEKNENCVLLLPLGHRFFRQVADFINKFRIDCRKLYVIGVDEFADEDGNVPPEAWPYGLYHAFLKNFYYRLDKDLRPPPGHILRPTKQNVNDLEQIIADLGGADLYECGIGWDGHVAMLYGDQKEYQAATLEEWKTMGPRIVTMSSWSIAMCALDQFLGMSGDWSCVPPKGITLGPAQIVRAKARESWNPFTIADTQVSWQRFAIRLALHGPADPRKLPGSIFQLVKTDFYMSETIAADIVMETEQDWY